LEQQLQDDSDTDKANRRWHLSAVRQQLTEAHRQLAAHQEKELPLMQQQVQLKIAVVNEKIKRLEQQLQDAPVTEKKVVLQRRLPVQMELTALLEEQALLTQQQIGAAGSRLYLKQCC
jgi:hypothetical protein